MSKIPKNSKLGADKMVKMAFFGASKSPTIDFTQNQEISHCGLVNNNQLFVYFFLGPKVRTKLRTKLWTKLRTSNPFAFN